jgi:hypothetical protein
MFSIPAKSALESALNAVVESAVELERRRRLARRIDGRIIGTGQADFTQKNTIYQLQLGRMPLQMIDVPGIEGNEKEYAGLVEEAVAKAHLVICVNGTNKKPEAKTAERIQRYLRRATKVLPVVNTRGYADAYEFEEDRESLATLKEPRNALKQTTEVLRKTLGEDTVLDGHCVQGLIAFSALAYDDRYGSTTIHPDRESDLVRHQRSFRETFASPGKMLAFSQIEQISEALASRASTFKSDIVEANKCQILALLAETSDKLDVMLQQHQAFMADVTPHFDHCLEAIVGISEGFLEEASSHRQQLCVEFFQAMTASADEVVAAHFGDQSAITRALELAQKKHQGIQSAAWEKWMARAVKQMNSDLQRATNRLMQDVARREVQLNFAALKSNSSGGVAGTKLEMDLSLKDWGKMFFNVGSYAASGFGIGTAFPVIGNVVGAVVGTLVGLAKAAADFFTGKAERIRKAQKQLHGQIEALRQEQLVELENAHEAMALEISGETEKHLRRPLEKLLKTLDQPQGILKPQMQLLARIKTQLEEMPRGSIRAI